MAENGNDVTTCPICLELYQSSGNRVPRILPCTHTVCENCISKLIRDTSFRCPECRVKHYAEQGVKSFPQNKYILTFINRNTSDVDLPISDQCHRHKRPQSLYCSEAGCHKPICLLCLKDDHRNHDFDDLDQVKQQKYDLMTTNIEGLKENLMSSRVKFLAKKMEINRDSEVCLQKVKNSKAEFVKIFDNFITEVSEAIETTNKKIDDEVSMIDENITLLDSLKENIVGAQESITCQTEIVKGIADNIQKTISGPRIFKFHDFSPSEDLDALCGKLEEKETLIDLGEVMPLLEELKDEIVEVEKIEDDKHEDEMVVVEEFKNKFNVRLTESFDTEYKHIWYISLSVEDRVVVCGEVDREWKLNDYRLQDGGIVDSVSLYEAPFGMTFIQFVDTPCIALSFWASKKIEFRNAYDLSEVVHKYSVAPHQPVRVCTLKPSTLLYADDSEKQREIRWVDCGSSPPSPRPSPPSITHTLQGYTFDMCCSTHDETQFLNTTYSSSCVYAYDVMMDRFEWKSEPSGIGKKMNAFGVTSDERGHVFVCDMSNGCIHAFSTAGVYMGRLGVCCLHGEEAGVEGEGAEDEAVGVPRCIRWRDENSSLVVAHKKRNRRIISVISIQRLTPS